MVLIVYVVAMALDNLLGKMHDDEYELLEEKLRGIERQVMLRRLESIGMSVLLIRQIDDLTLQILKLEPEGGMPDLHLRERMTT